MALDQYNLTSVVNELLIELGEGQTNKFARYYQLGTACLRDQNMDLSGFPKIVSLLVNSDDTVDLPSDYMNYSRIAICDANGVLHSLGRNDNLCLNQNFNNCGVPVRHGIGFAGTPPCTPTTIIIQEVLPVWSIEKVVFNPLVTHITFYANGNAISNAVPVSSFAVNSIQDIVDDINGFGSTFAASFINTSQFALSSSSPSNNSITYITDDPGGTIVSITQTIQGVTGGTTTTTCNSSTCSTCNSNSTFNSPIINAGFGTGEWVDDNYRNGELMGRFFGIGGGNNANGYFRIDVPNGKILLAGGWAWNCSGQMPNIVLEYLADIEASGDDYVVHPFLIETVKDYIFWKSISRDRSRNMNEKEAAKRDYQQSERMSRIRFNSRTITEWEMAFRTANTAAVKW